MNPFECVLNSIAELLHKKNTDYGSSYWELRDKYGSVCFYSRIAEKLARIEQIDKNGHLVDESAIDTLKDIIGYCTLELIYRERLTEGKTDKS